MNKQKTIAAFCKARKGTEEMVIVEGVHAFKHALRFGARFHDVFTVDKKAVCALTAEIATDSEVEAVQHLAVEVDTAFFSQLAPNALRTGLVARAYIGCNDCAAQSLDENKPIIFLENPHDTENVGAVVRVAAGYGAAAVMVSGGMHPWHANCIRSSAGLHWALPVCHVESVEELLIGRQVVICGMNGKDMYNTELQRNAIMIFGTERYGVTDALKKKADITITIPMQKDVSSLNLATSVSAVLYGAMR